MAKNMYLCTRKGLPTAVAHKRKTGGHNKAFMDVDCDRLKHPDGET